jgi:hypothetical protein
VDAGNWLFEGTSATDGQSFPDIIGNEVDSYFASGAPANLEIVGYGPIKCGGKTVYHTSSYYTTSSGAGVFATGSIWWDSYLMGNGTASSAAFATRVTENMLRVFAAGPAGLTHPSVPNAKVVTKGTKGQTTETPDNDRGGTGDATAGTPNG